MPKTATPLYLVYGGDALDAFLYRIVGRCPPVVEDFLSYEALRFVKAEPSAVEHLEIWDDDEEIKLNVDPRKIAAATAA